MALTLIPTAGSPSTIVNGGIRLPYRDIASAGTVDVTTGNFWNITGTTTITAFTSPTYGNPIVHVIFAGALTLTHGTNFFLVNNGSNITTAAGDYARFRYEGSNKWQMICYTKANGLALSDSTTSGYSISGGAVFGYGSSTIASYTGTSTGFNSPLSSTGSFVQTYDYGFSCGHVAVGAYGVGVWGTSVTGKVGVCDVYCLSASHYASTSGSTPSTLTHNLILNGIHQCYRTYYSAVSGTVGSSSFDTAYSFVRAVSGTGAGTLCNFTFAVSSQYLYYMCNSQYVSHLSILTSGSTSANVLLLTKSVIVGAYYNNPQSFLIEASTTPTTASALFGHSPHPHSENEFVSSESHNSSTYTSDKFTNSFNILSNVTTNNTKTELLIGSVNSTYPKSYLALTYGLATNHVIANSIKLNVLAVDQGSDDWATWELTCLVTNNGSGTTVLYGGVTAQAPTNNSAGAASWDLDVELGTAPHRLKISGTGENSKTITWVATADIDRAKN